MKKALSMALVCLLVLSMAACSGSQTGNESTQPAVAESPEPQTEKSESLPQSAETSAAPNTDVTTVADSGEKNLYGFDEPVSIKVGFAYPADFTWFGGETSRDNTWVDLYAENNIQLDVLYDVDASQAETKLSVAIMSGNYPDIFSATASQYKSYVEAGVIADITDVYEEYASEELKAYMEIDSGMAIDASKIDGRLYGLPKVGDPYSSSFMMFIRQDWLDRLGLEIPKTMDELKLVAQAFTHDDPDGNGANDTYGLVLDGINVINNSVGNTDPIFNAYGVYLGSTGMTYIEQDNGDITWGGANTEGMKSALQFLQDLYADGSLAKDFITMDSNSVFAESGASRCGIWFAPNWGGMDPAMNSFQNDINSHIVAAPVPDGINQGGTKSYISSSSDKIYCVSSKCENPEVLIKLWNLSVKYQHPNYATPEEYNMYYGDSANYSGWKASLIEGGPPNLGKDTYIKLKEALASGDTSSLNTKEIENYTAIKTYIDAVEVGTLDPSEVINQRGIALYTVYGDPLCAWEVNLELMNDNRFILSAYNALPSDATADAIPTLKKLLIETIIKIVTGADSVDSYDSFLDTWYAMGGQVALDEVNAQ